MAGTINLKKRGGCTRFYDLGGRVAVVEAVNKKDWNEAVRSVIDHGCSTDIAWFVLGLSAERMGKFAAARTYYEQSIAIGKKFSMSNIYNTCDGVKTQQNTCLGIDVPGDAANALERISSSR